MNYITKTLVAAAAGAALTLGVAGAAKAVEITDMKCYTLNSVMDKLKRNYGENVHGTYAKKDGHMFQTWANKDTGSWTLLLLKEINGSAAACVVASGDSHFGPGKVEPKGDPA